MRRVFAILAAGLMLASLPPANAADNWTAPRNPFRLYGNAYFVGSQGLSAVLITSDSGHVLIDGALPESAPLIEQSIQKLGFRIGDVKYILNSHTHYDHAGGIPALRKRSGATVVASEWSAAAFRNGGGDQADPQYSPVRQFEPVSKVQVIEDGGVLRLGSLELTAHYTPGHTPGGTTWTWRSCEDTRCLDMVYADSLNAVGSNTYRFSDPLPRAYFQKSFAVFESLPCDIVVSAHPEASGLWERLAARDAGDTDALIDRNGCREYAPGPNARWLQRLEAERSGF